LLADLSQNCSAGLVTALFPPLVPLENKKVFLETKSISQNLVTSSFSDQSQVML
jgi:hypothetical protein